MTKAKDGRLADVTVYDFMDFFNINQYMPERKYDHNRQRILNIVRDDLERGLRQGALACLQKPIAGADLEAAFANIRAFLDRDVRSLLVVEDDPNERDGILNFVRLEKPEPFVHIGRDALRAERFLEFAVAVAGAKEDFRTWRASEK